MAPPALVLDFAQLAPMQERLMIKRRVLAVIGTRPEAIKMAPVISELRRQPDAFDCIVCTTSQHREMLARTLQVFDLQADYDLSVMQAGQGPLDVLTLVLQRLRAPLETFAPDLVLVQGDTTSALAAALAGSYSRLPVAHVEAGLRTHDDAAPWPEETNRRLVDGLSSLHFAPTLSARDNLLREGFGPDTVRVTGNTGIDSLLQIRQRLAQTGGPGSKERRSVVVTCHRRECIPDGIAEICRAVVLLAARFTDCDFVVPLHPNPKVRAIALPVLCAAQASNIRLVEPLDYPQFVAMLSECYIVLTDSGGIEEEAPYLGKPVLVLRDTTDRPEILDAGTARLVGTRTDRIVAEATDLLQDHEQYGLMSRIHHPYGDGQAAKRVVAGLLEAFDAGLGRRKTKCT
jgi:UDP-N-acetylglucosamine 2-epimerase (non-hydrolysing)